MKTVLKVLRRLLVTVVVLGLIVVVGGGAYYASQLMPALAPAPPAYDVEVTAATGNQITLDATDALEYMLGDVLSPGVFGFEHATGYARIVGNPTASTAVGATRTMEVVTGEMPVVGTRGEVQAYAFPEDPGLLGGQEINITGPLGSYPAWRFPGDSSTVVILVHGRGATRAESLRVTEIAGRLGFPALVVTYRNDGTAPKTEDGYGHFGQTEWLDLDAAVTYARTTMASKRLLIVGHSQGGSVVTTWYRNTANTNDVGGLILDSPILSIQRTLVQQAENRDIPGPLVAPILTVTKAIADVVGDIDFAALEQVEAADDFQVPILLFHGREDTNVPFAPSKDFADARTDIVTFVPYSGEHVRGWNLIQDAYVNNVERFLQANG